MFYLMRLCRISDRYELSAVQVMTSGTQYIKGNHSVYICSVCLRVHKAVLLYSNESGAQSWLPQTLAPYPATRSVPTWRQSWRSQKPCDRVSSLTCDVLTCILGLPISKLGVYLHLFHWQRSREAVCDRRSQCMPEYVCNAVGHFVTSVD